MGPIGKTCFYDVIFKVSPVVLEMPEEPRFARPQTSRDIQTGAKKSEHLDPSLDLQEIWLDSLQMSLILCIYLFVVDHTYGGRFHPTW